MAEAGQVTFGATEQNAIALNKTAATLRKQLLQLPLLGCNVTLSHMTIRPGIRYAEVVGEMSGDMQFGPYSKTRKDTSDVVINPRELYAYFGSVVKEFDPNSVYKTIWGSAITKGEALKTTDITRQVLQFLTGKLGKNLNAHIWDAVRNDTGDTTKDLFNGFDTITAAEIKAGNIATAKKNLFEFTEAIDNTNAVELLKAFYRAASDELQGDEIAGSEPKKLFISRSIYNAYNDDYQQTVGATPYNKEYKKTFLEGTNDGVELVPLANKKDSPYIHLSTKQNMLIGVNQQGEEEQVNVEKYSPFVLTFVATMFFGAQFETIDPSRLLVGKLFTE
jgi:hypothetical protein